MKKFLAGLVMGLILATATFAFAAPQAIKLIINGQEIHPDVPPQMIEGRVMVPARFVAEPLGATVEWDGSTNSVIITSAPTEVSVDQAAPAEQNNLEGVNMTMNEWISFDALMKDYGVFIKVGDQITLRGNGIELRFNHPGASDRTLTLTTDKGYTLTIKIQNARFYLDRAELQTIGLIS